MLAQTLVRRGRAAHGPANAVMLPHTLEALAWRWPRQAEALAEALGRRPAAAAATLCARTGATRLRDLGIDRSGARRVRRRGGGAPELDHTPPRADRAELRALYAAAW